MADEANQSETQDSPHEVVAPDEKEPKKTKPAKSRKSQSAQEESREQDDSRRQERVVVELSGGESENYRTSYGTFSKGVSVEVTRDMADYLLQLTDDNDEQVFKEL